MAKLADSEKLIWELKARIEELTEECVEQAKIANGAMAHATRLEEALKLYTDFRTKQFIDDGEPQYGDVPPWQSYPLSALYDALPKESPFPTPKMEELH